MSAGTSCGPANTCAPGRRRRRARRRRRSTSASNGSRSPVAGERDALAVDAGERAGVAARAPQRRVTSANVAGPGPPSPNGSATDAGRLRNSMPGASSASRSWRPPSSCSASSASSAATPPPATITRGRRCLWSGSHRHTSSGPSRSPRRGIPARRCRSPCSSRDRSRRRTRRPGSSLITALSGQTPKQLSQAKQLPHDRQRRASKSAVEASSPPVTSSNVDCRRASSSCGRTMRGASE